MVRLLVILALVAGPLLAQESKPEIKLLINSADEPMAKAVSFEKSAAFLDHQSQAWTAIKKCGTCHTTVAWTPAGLPVGVQVVAPFLEDRTALRFAPGFTPPPAPEREALPPPPRPSPGDEPPPKAM